MKLEVACSWNEKKNRAKQTIYFDYRPKAIFCLPNEKVALIQKLGHTASFEGPSVLEQLKNIVEKNPKSLYAAFVYYQTLLFFEYFDEANKLFAKLKETFPKQVLIQTSIATSFLNDKNYEKVPSVFNHIEVLKGAFPHRRSFFFEEALLFHNLWACYFFETGNEIQSQKHQQFIALIMNTLQSYQAVAQ